VSLGSSSLEARGTPRVPEDLVDHDCFACEATNSRDWNFRKAGADYAVAISHRLMVTMVETAIDAALARVGIARLMSYHAAGYAANGQLRIVLEEFEPSWRPLSLVRCCIARRYDWDAAVLSFQCANGDTEVQLEFALFLQAPIEHQVGATLRFGVGEAGPKQSRVGAVIVNPRQCDVVDPAFDVDQAFTRKAGNPVGKFVDEGVELGVGQRSVDPSVPLGEIRSVILCAANHFHCATATQKTGKVLYGAPARDDSETRFDLAKDGPFTGGEPHIAGQCKLTAGTASPSRYFCNGHGFRCTQAPEQKPQGRLAGQYSGFLSILSDLFNVDVVRKELCIAAGKDNYAVGRPLIERLNQIDEVGDQCWPDQIQRGAVNFDEQDALIGANLEGLE
jgi:hypothetical protein